MFIVHSRKRVPVIGFLRFLSVIFSALQPSMQNNWRRRHKPNTNIYPIQHPIQHLAFSIPSSRSKQLFKILCHCQHTRKKFTRVSFPVYLQFLDTSMPVDWRSLLPKYLSGSQKVAAEEHLCLHVTICSSYCNILRLNS